MTGGAMQTLACRCGRLVRAGAEAVAVTCDRCDQRRAMRAEKRLNDSARPAGRTCPDCGAALVSRRRYCPTCARKRRRQAARVCRVHRHATDATLQAPAMAVAAVLGGRQAADRAGVDVHTPPPVKCCALVGAAGQPEGAKA